MSEKSNLYQQLLQLQKPHDPKSVFHQVTQPIIDECDRIQRVNRLQNDLQINLETVIQIQRHIADNYDDHLKNRLPCVRQMKLSTCEHTVETRRGEIMQLKKHYEKRTGYKLDFSDKVDKYILFIAIHETLWTIIEELRIRSRHLPKTLKDPPHIFINEDTDTSDRRFNP